MMRRGEIHRIGRVLLLAGVAVLAQGTTCGLKEGMERSVDKVLDQLKVTTNKSLSVIDEGIRTLGNNSASWQTVLQDMQAKLTADGQQLVRNDIRNLLDHSSRR
jgi:hypothetical protein